MTVLATLFGVFVPGSASAAIQSLSGLTTVSVSATGVPIPVTGGYVQALGASYDGQRVLMTTAEGNPWPNGGARWYVKDLSTGELRLISNRIDGTSGTVIGYQPYGATANLVSSDGRYFAYTSYDRLIDPNVTANGSGVHSYVYDYTINRSVLAETNSAGQPVQGGTNSLKQMSWDGRYVLMDLIGNNTGHAPVGAVSYEASYIKDLQTGALSVVSASSLPDVALSGTAYRNPVVAVAMSNDANLIIYRPYGINDLYLLQRSTGQVWDLSPGVNRIDDHSDMTPDGRYVLVGTYSPLIPGDQSNTYDQYVLDLQDIMSGGNGRPRLASYSDRPSINSSCANWTYCHYSVLGQISDDGRFVFSESNYPLDSTVQPTPTGWHMFVHDLGDGSVKNISYDVGGKRDPRLILSGDGRRVVWSATSTQVVVRTVTPVPSDTTAPIVTGTVSPNSTGWNNSDVTVTWSVNDDSGTATVPPSTSVTSEGANQLVTSGQSCDTSGNCSTGSVLVSIDKTPPVSDVTGVANGGVYPSNQAPVPACSDSDSLSGVATASNISVANAGTLYTATCAGAVDVAGNTGSAVTVSYTVTTQPVATAVVVSSTGAPLAGVPVSFRSSGGAVTTATTGADGKATAGVNPGSYTVTATYARGLQNQSLDVTTFGANTVTFTTVNVTVQISGPTPSDLASATVRHAGNTGSFGPHTAVSSAGVVNFEVLPGTNTFTAWVNGGYQSKTVVVTAGSSPTVNFTTETVTVQISGPTPSDLASATVRHAGNTGSFGPHTAVDANGQVTFQALPGTSTFTAWVARGYQSKTITVVAGSTNTVSFATVNVLVTVLDTNGVPRANSTVRHAGNTGSFGPHTAVDANGQVTFPVLPGTNTFTAWVGSSYKTSSLQVTADTSLTITV